MQTVDHRTTKKTTKPAGWWPVAVINSPTRFSSPLMIGEMRVWRVSSFVEAEDVLDGLHEGHVGVCVAILVDLVLIRFNCVGFDNRDVAFAVVITDKQQQDIA